MRNSSCRNSGCHRIRNEGNLPVSELVVNLQDPESVALARRVLDSLGNDWPNPTTSGVSASRDGGAAGGSASVSADLPPWEGPNELGGSQSNSKPVDNDPWATSAPSP